MGVSGGASASFVYDGDGQRVKATIGTTTTVYIGDYYEQTGSTVRKYYYPGGQRVAMRENSTLYYLLTDHLGSTAVTANASGGKYGELRYKAWGETRYTWGTTPTTWRFTGQREDVTIGLYFYNARFYDPQLGRFVQPDTIVPEPGDPQALNRYSYVLNQPTVLTDPTGRCPWCGAALVGAIIGGGMSWARQAMANRQEGMSWQDAALTVNVGEIVGAAVGGAIIAGSFGAAAFYVGAGSVAGIGLGGTIGLGAATNVAANQASHLVSATVNEALDWVKGRNDFSTADVISTAYASGFLDPGQIVIDSFSGAIAGGVAYPAALGLTKAAQSLGLLEQNLQRTPIWTVQFLPGGGLTATTGRSR